MLLLHRRQVPFRQFSQPVLTLGLLADARPNASTLGLTETGARAVLRLPTFSLKADSVKVLLVLAFFPGPRHCTCVLSPNKGFSLERECKIGGGFTSGEATPPRLSVIPEGFLRGVCRAVGIPLLETGVDVAEEEEEDDKEQTGIDAEVEEGGGGGKEVEDGEERLSRAFLERESRNFLAAGVG